MQHRIDEKGNLPKGHSKGAPSKVTFIGHLIDGYRSPIRRFVTFLHQFR